MRTKPKICQIMLARGFGGAERLFVDLVLELLDYGIDVLPLCHPQGEAKAKLEQSGVDCLGIKSLGWWDPVAPFKIRRIVQTHNVDIVHTHLARATYLTSCAHIRRPFIASLHNYGKSKYYKQADRYIPITHDGARHLQAMGISRERITVIPNFSRMSAVDNIDKHSNLTPRILAYGRFVEKKGFHILLEAAALLKEREINFELQLGGDGPLFDYLKARASALKLEEQVRFTGWLDDVKKALDEADIFVLPSNSEPFGIVVLEAMARGTPIVATRTEGPNEILSDDMAYLVKIGDPTALADALENAINTPEYRCNKAIKALGTYKEKYCSPVVIKNFIALYSNIITQKDFINQ